MRKKKLINQYALNKHQKTRGKKRRNRGSIITLIDLALILIFAVTIFPQLKKKAETITHYQGYQITLNSINFNGRTLVELRLRLDENGTAITEEFTLTFYDGETLLVQYPFTFPQSRADQVSEFSLPPVSAPDVIAVLSHNGEAIKIKSTIKAAHF